MLAKITLYDGTVYKIASKTVDTEDGIYLGRIRDELSLVSAMQEAGNAPETISLTIINYDNFIPHNKDLWAADVLLTNDNNISWRGKINFCNFDSDGNLYVTASEKTAPELELQLPDEVRQVYTIDEDFHQSSVTMTIPLVIGGTTSNPITLPTILIDKTRGIYLICVGEIRSIVKVYNGAEQLPQTAYTAYTGTANQEENAGFAYVQIAEDYRINSDGTYAEINVDVVGLKLGNHTEAECRNGARFLYYFLTTADTGINGWGCGIDSNLIDITSFNSAITLCDQLGYKLDGIMWLRQSAQSWIDQICQAIHGKYSINANGKRSLFIDYAGNASKKTFTASNMRVDRYGKNSYTSVVYNKGVLSYDYNPITGLFMQSAQYENAESIAQIGEQKFVGESYLIKDATTALAVLEYTCKRSQIAAEAIEFDTDAVETNLRAGDIITINRPDLNLNNALYQIQSISTTDFISSIIAVKFDTSVFSVTGTASTVNWGNEKDITPALTPAQATNLLLSTGFDINPDGTGIPYISGTFTVPDGGWLAAAVQYGIGSNPSNWTELALITEGRFKISPVNVGSVYSVRVRMITATGHSSYITGQITSTGDTTPPAKPTITASATDRTVTVQCGLDSPPYDMGGFQIFRKKHSESVYTLIGYVAANRGYASFTDYVDEYIAYDYQAKSYDRSGNLSDYADSAALVYVTGIQANDVAATALAMPTGSILRLSAKNCTTESIAEANGVKDVSGNGNHGQANGGVTVVRDSEMGDCFSFDGTDDYILDSASTLLSKINTCNGFTITFRAKCNNLAKDERIGGFLATTRFAGVAFKNVENQIGFGDRSKYDDEILYIYFNMGNELLNWHTYSFSVDYANGIAIIYIDGEEKARDENFFVAANKQDVTAFWLGCTNNVRYFDGSIADIRVYPRALTASEIKTIYMFPDDVTFGQMTADLIGTNILKAENLVKTEALITTTAQIDQAIFQSLIVTNGSTVANQVDVGGRNLLKESNKGWSGTAYNFADIYFGNEKPQDGDMVTITFKGVCGKSAWRLFNSGGSITIQSKISASSAINGVWTWTGAWRVEGSSNTFLRIYNGSSSSDTSTGTSSIEWVKLEYGNKATTWTPAPEDVDASIASGDSSTLSSAKTYADGKASTAQSDAEAAAAAALAAVTNNIYYTGTTLINGGVIQTGSIGVAAIAANSITADKINAYSGTPRSCLFSLNFKCVQSATAGTPVPDMSGYNNHFEIAGTWNMLYKGAAYCEYILLDNTSEGRGHYVVNKKSITVPASGWTFLICAYAHANGSGEHVLFDFKPSSGNNNRIQFRIDPDNNRIRIRSWNSSGTTESKYGALASCTRGSYLCYVVQCTSTTSITVYCVAERRGDELDTASNKVTITLSNARSALTSPARYLQIGGTGSTSEETASIVGNIGDIQFYNRALSLAELKQIVHNVGNYDSGLITAERMETNAIKSRNYDYSSGLYSTAGTFLDLANGQIISKNFSIDSSGNATFKGALSGATGSFSGTITASGGTFNTLQMNQSKSLTLGIWAAQTYNCSLYNQVTSTNNIGLALSTTATSGDFSGAALICLEQSTSSKQSDPTIKPAALFQSQYGTAISVFNNNGIGLHVYNSQGKGYTDNSHAGIYLESANSNYVSIYNKLGKCLSVSGWTTSCDESIKKDIKDISTLEKLKEIRVKKFKYSQKAIQEKDWLRNEKERITEESKKGGEVEIRKMPEFKDDENAPDYIMAMAGEFNKAFGVDNGNEEEINYTNAIGVALRAIQELAAEVDELKAKLKIQQNEKSDVEQEIQQEEQK